ncbi:hypothetical protein JTB14_014116 [Gonioctena quinquepunctata]|nr:hypothetical protein JTB14_014116 [Gonioctena quinquepunctata]
MDMAGSFLIISRRARGVKSYKSYLCLFVCIATKAVHLELVSYWSTEAFLAALRGFIARRGRCSHLYCDSGINSIGARISEAIVTKEQIQFHINCPRASNFGGLWESGIKSVKSHLYRVIGSKILTFEELYTVFVQFEAVLNARTLCQF